MNEFRQPLIEAAATQHHHDRMREAAAQTRAARLTRASRGRGRRSPDGL